MPAKNFITEFPFDPASFNFEQFKAKLIAEIDGDTDLATAALTAATTERDTLKTDVSGLKVRLFDATIGKQGEPVTPNDSPAGTASGGSNGAAPAVPDSDIFG